MNLPKKIKQIESLEVGYLILDSLNNREDYIERVLRTNVATVLGVNESVYHECPFMNGYNKNYKVPNEIGELGSAIVLGKVKGTNTRIIMGTLTVNNKEENLKLENEFQDKNKFETDECIIFIDKDPKNGNLGISVLGKKSNYANLNINVIGNNNDGNVNINVNGNVNINATENVNINAEKEFLLQVRNSQQNDKWNKIEYINGQGFILEDEYDNKVITRQDGVIIKSEKIGLQGKIEKLSLVKILLALLKAIKNMTFKHPQGPTLPVPINWQTEFNEVENNIKDLFNIKE